MADILQETIEQLQQVGMDADEALVYTELTRHPATHLQLSRITGISRTKIYRVAARLEKKGLVTRRSDDRGMFLVAGDPLYLEEAIRQNEAQAEAQRKAMEKVSVMLPLLQSDEANELVVRTYDGVEGMKQMQWHELKTKKELLCLGYLTYEELVDSRRWSEDFRRRIADAGFTTKELMCRIPRGYTPEPTVSSSETYMQHYFLRKLTGTAALKVATPMVIYNDTVAIYQVDQERKFGLEIINAGYAALMREVFNRYWELGVPMN